METKPEKIIIEVFDSSKESRLRITCKTYKQAIRELKRINEYG